MSASEKPPRPSATSVFGSLSERTAQLRRLIAGAAALRERSSALRHQIHRPTSEEDSLDEMSTPVPFPVVNRAMPLGRDTLVLVHEAFAMGLAMGRREGAQAVRQDMSKLLHDELERLEHDYDGLAPEDVQNFEMVFRPAQPTAVVAAYFGGAVDALCLALSRARGSKR